jgi:hypothetical protein
MMRRHVVLVNRCCLIESHELTLTILTWTKIHQRMNFTAQWSTTAKSSPAVSFTGTQETSIAPIVLGSHHPLNVSFD